MRAGSCAYTHSHECTLHISPPPFSLLLYPSLHLTPYASTITDSATQSLPLSHPPTLPRSSTHFNPHRQACKDGLSEKREVVQCQATHTCAVVKAGLTCCLGSLQPLPQALDSSHKHVLETAATFEALAWSGTSPPSLFALPRDRAGASAGPSYFGDGPQQRTDRENGPAQEGTAPSSPSTYAHSLKKLKGVRAASRGQRSVDSDAADPFMGIPGDREPRPAAGNVMASANVAEAVVPRGPSPSMRQGHDVAREFGVTPASGLSQSAIGGEEEAAETAAHEASRRGKRLGVQVSALRERFFNWESASASARSVKKSSAPTPPVTPAGESGRRVKAIVSALQSDVVRILSECIADGGRAFLHAGHVRQLCGKWPVVVY